MSRATFSIAYDGPALEGGTMDVRDLAPALLAVGQLFDAANKVLNEDRIKSVVRVKATGMGSFEVFLELSQAPWQQVVKFFSSDSVTAAVNIRDLIFGSFGIVFLYKWLKGRQADRVDKLDDNTVRLTVGDDSIDIPTELFRLTKEPLIQAALENLITKPLKREGINLFKEHHEENTLEVDESECDYLATPPDPSDLLIQSTRQAAFSILSVAFKKDNSWRLHDGSATISAKVEDQDFLRRIDANQESFAKGDTLICEVKTTQYLTKKGLKVKHVIDRVVEHRSAAQQLNFKLGKDDSDEPTS